MAEGREDVSERYYQNETVRQRMLKFLAQERPWKIVCDTKAAAQSFRHRVNEVKAASRRDNRKAYEQGEGLWNKSDFDDLRQQLTYEDEVWIIRWTKDTREVHGTDEPIVE